MPPDLPLHWFADSLDHAVKAIVFSPRKAVCLGNRVESLRPTQGNRPRLRVNEALAFAKLKTKNDVDRRGKYGVVARVVEWLGIAEGMIDA